MTSANLSRRWALTVSVAASLAIHALLLGAASVALLRAEQSVELIRVTLAPGGGKGAAPGGRIGNDPAAGPKFQGELMPAAERSLPPRVERRVAPHPLRPEPKAARPVKAVAPVVPPPAAPNSGPLVAGIPADSVERPAVASAPAAVGGDGLGGGNGTGAGDGSGEGGGRGGGSGRGVGGGRDQRAYCISCPEPSYPLLARTRGWEGTVDVGLAVRADGSVDRIIVRRSSGYEVLDRAALSAAQASRFRPPIADGVQVAVEGFIEYRFKLVQGR